DRGDDHAAAGPAHPAARARRLEPHPARPAGDVDPDHHHGEVDLKRVGWAKAATMLKTLYIRPLRRAHALDCPRGHGGTDVAQPRRRLGRLCPPYFFQTH